MNQQVTSNVTRSVGRTWGLAARGLNWSVFFIYFVSSGFKASQGSCGHALNSYYGAAKRNVKTHERSCRDCICLFSFLIYQIKSTIHVWKSTSHIAHPMRNGGFSTWPGRSLHPTPRPASPIAGNTTAKGLVAWIGYIYIWYIYVYIGYNSTLIIGVKKNHTKKSPSQRTQFFLSNPSDPSVVQDTGVATPP